MLRKSLLFSISAFAFSLSGQAETLKDALDQAFRTNPQLEVQRSEVDVAEEQLRQARGQRAATVDVSGSAGFESLDSNRPLAFDIGDRPIATAQLQATLPVYTGGQISAGIERAKSGVKAASAQLDGASQDLILQVVTAYVDVLRDQEAVRIRENSVALLQEQLRAATDRFEVGFSTRTDVKQAEARLEGAKAALAGAEAQLEGSLAIYALRVGQEAGDLVPVRFAPPVPESFEVALEIALQNNPDLKALREAERAADQAIEAARGATRPSVSIVGRAAVQETFGIEATTISPTMGVITLDEDNYRDTQMSVFAQARIPLYQGGVLRSQVRSAQIQRDQARLQTMNAQREVRAGLAQAWYGNLAALQAIEASERQVEAAEIAYEGAQEELSVGTRTTLDVLDQEQQLLEARLGVINARRDAYVAAHQLLRATGQLALDSGFYDPAQIAER